jgi:hypothetical protein
LFNKFLFFELKGYFVSDFNAFVNYAYDDNPSLDSLELEIPGKALEELRLVSFNLNGPVTNI